MFLERKFMTELERSDARAASGDLARFPDEVRDVVANLGRVLASERGIAHLLPDFGFSRSGQSSAQGLMSHCTRELREILPRYEPRLTLVDIEGELDDDGHPALLVIGRIAGAEGLVTLTLDPVARRVSGVRIE